MREVAGAGLVSAAVLCVLSAVLLDYREHGLHWPFGSLADRALPLAIAAIALALSGGYLLGWLGE